MNRYRNFHYFDFALDIAVRATSVPILEFLAKTDWLGISGKVASNLAASPDLLFRLAHHQHDYVRAGVAANPACPLAILEILTRDESDEVIYAVASNPAASAPILDYLARKRSSVKLLIAQNPSSTPAILQYLSGADTVGTLVAVAENQSTPSETLAQMWLNSLELTRRAAKMVTSGRKEIEARSLLFNRYLQVALASNPNTPAETLRQAARETHPEIRRALAANPVYVGEGVPGLPVEFGNAVQASAAEALTEFDGMAELASKSEAEDPDEPELGAETVTDPDELASMAGHPDLHIRLRAAKNVLTPSKVLQELANDRAWRVRVAVAANVSTATETLCAMASDTEPIQEALAGNPSTPLDILQGLVDLHSDIRAAMSVNVNATGDVLFKLLTAPEPHVRMNAALMELVRQHEPTLLLTSSPESRLA